MQFAAIRDFRINATAVLRKAGSEETVVVTLRGKPVGLFVPVTESLLEDMAQAVKLARLRASVSALRRDAAASGTDKLGPREVQRVIRAGRRARRA